MAEDIVVLFSGHIEICSALWWRRSLASGCPSELHTRRIEVQALPIIHLMHKRTNLTRKRTLRTAEQDRPDAALLHGGVVIRDNPAAHKATGAEDAIRASEQACRICHLVVPSLIRSRDSSTRHGRDPKQPRR